MAKSCSQPVNLPGAQPLNTINNAGMFSLTCDNKGGTGFGIAFSPKSEGRRPLGGSGGKWLKFLGLKSRSAFSFVRERRSSVL